MPSADLGSFLSRPVVIDKYSWTEGSERVFQFDPWYQFLNKSTTKKKTEGYKLWRGKLKVKILINASPYQYSALMVSYKPLATAVGGGGSVPVVGEYLDFSGGVAALGSSGTYTDPEWQQSMVARSLRPGTIIYPHLCEGGDLTLPFVWYEDWASFPYGEVQSVDYISLGVLTMQSITPLRSCSGAVGSACEITVLAWMEDVELTAPTFTPQSIFFNSPAKVVSEVAKSVSQNASYSATTRVGAAMAGAAADVASMMGFTKHSVIQDTKPVRIVSNLNQAVTDVNTSGDVLAVESGNNLFIGPSNIAPSDEDQMSIPFVCGKECMLPLVDWHQTDGPEDVLLRLYVTPLSGVAVPKVGNTSQNYYAIQFTNMGMVASMFKYWRGPITYTFQVVGTAFHKGRLYVTWEPDDNVGTNFDPTLQRTEILDISQADRVSITVDYMAGTGWLETGSKWLQFGQLGGAVPSDCNGTLTIRVMNPLTSPVADAPVSILTWVKGPNLEFAYPCAPADDERIETFRDQFEAQSIPVAVPTETQVSTLGAKEPTVANGVYMGETVSSLRSLCQRTCLLYSNWFTTAAIGRFNILTHLPRFTQPLYTEFGGVNYYPFQFGSGAATDGGPFTTLPFHKVAGCYTGLRGSMEFRVARSGRSEIENLEVSVYRKPMPFSGINPIGVGSSTNSVRDLLALPAGVSGKSSVAGDDSDVLVTKIPMYSRYKFLPANFGIQRPEAREDWIMINHELDSPGNIQFGFKILVNAGDDFTAGWYLNPPLMYFSENAASVIV